MILEEFLAAWIGAERRLLPTKTITWVKLRHAGTIPVDVDQHRVFATLSNGRQPLWFAGWPIRLWLGTGQPGPSFDSLRQINGGEDDACTVQAYLNLDINFYFAVAGFHVPPFQFFFMPYDFLGVAALFTHLACAVYRHSRSLPRVARILIVAVPFAAGAAV